MYLKPKSKPIQWGDSWSCSHLQRSNTVALGLTLLPLADTDPGRGDLSLNPPQLDTVKTEASASQSSRSEEATEVGVFPGIRCHTPNTPLLPLCKTCGFFSWILHVSSPPSLASQQISLPLVHPPVCAQSVFARTSCFQHLTLPLNTVKVPAVAQVPTCCALVSPQGIKQDTGAPRLTVGLHSHKPS